MEFGFYCLYRWSRVRFSAAATDNGMGDRLRAAKPPQYLTKPSTGQPTQPPTLSGTGNEYQPKCADDQRLWSKKQLWLITLVDKRACGWQVKLSDPSLTRSIPV